MSYVKSVIRNGRKERRKDFSGERADVIGPSEIVAAVDEFRKKLPTPSQKNTHTMKL